MTLRLDRLEAGQPITSDGKGPSLAFQVWAQRLVENLEAAVNNIEEVVSSLGALLGQVIDLNDLVTTVEAAAAAAQAAADSAQAAADTANGSAGELAEQTSQITSFPSLLSITAVDAGASVTINISAHNRIYPQPDGTTVTVAVNGGSLTGRPYNTDLWLYYDDPARAGGAVTYQSTTAPNAAAQVGVRHALGGVHTPLAAAPPASGRVLRAPGYVDLQ